MLDNNSIGNTFHVHMGRNKSGNTVVDISHWRLYMEALINVITHTGCSFTLYMHL